MLSARLREDYWMNEGILTIMSTFVTLYRTVDSNLKAFCANNVYFFDSSYQKTSNFNYSF